MHNDNKFDYGKEGIAHRKHIVVNRIIFITTFENYTERQAII